MSIVNVDVGGVVDGLFKGIDSLFTSDEERESARLKMQIELQKPHMMQAMATIHEAQHPNWFVAGARPAILWICATCLAYHWILKDLLIIGFVTFHPAPDTVVDMLPVIDSGEITGLVMSLLGLGAFRSYEKTKRVARG